MKLFWAIGFLLATNLACGKIEPKSAEEVVAESVHGSGIVKARNQHDVFSAVSGIIHRILVAESDTISVGTPLMLISDESVQLDKSNAELTAAFYSVYSNAEKITELKNNILLAKAKFNIDSLNLIRQKDLFAKSLGTKEDLERKEIIFLSSGLAVQEAINTYKSVLKKLRQDPAQSANGLEINGISRSDYTVVSDINGKVYSIWKNQGEMVNPSMPLMLIGDAHQFYVELGVDAYAAGRIRPAQKVIMAIENYPGKIFEGLVTRIFSIVGEQKRTVKVEAEFTNRPPALHPFMTVEAEIIVEEQTYGLLASGDHSRPASSCVSTATALPRIIWNR